MKTKKFLYDQELTHSLTKMNGIKIIDSFAKLFCHHTNWQNATKAGRTNSRTNCQQNRIAISHQLLQLFPLPAGFLFLLIQILILNARSEVVCPKAWTQQPPKKNHFILHRHHHHQHTLSPPPPPTTPNHNHASCIAAIYYF